MDQGLPIIPVTESSLRVDSIMHSLLAVSINGILRFPNSAKDPTILQLTIAQALS